MEKKDRKSLIDVAAVRKNTAEQREGDGEIKIRQTEFPLKKPGQRVFFQAHPDPQYRLSNLPVLEDQERRLFYLQIGYQPPEDIRRFIHYMHIVTCITPRGSVFLWPIKSSTNDWQSSALRAAREAQDNWIRIHPKMDVGAYGIEAAPQELSSVAPAWPDTSFEEMINRTFEGRIIDDDNHPVIRELRGKP
jgi:hypothetical protein